jgi:DNA polymerase-3 subunit gamma/tau
MAGVNDAAARGVEWEALLVEMQSLLHRIAMVQLSPSALGADMAAVELRMRELARTVPPTDVQLYYQTLLIGRKELPYAPDRRMGVEMTLLRALAFHPRMPLPEPEVQPAQAAAPRQPAPQRRRHSRRRICRRPPARCWRPAASCSAAREQPPKRVNRQPLPRAAGE